jgi:hypothetical protein
MLHTLQDKRDHLDATFFTFLWDQHFVLLFDSIELRAPSQKMRNFTVLCIMQTFLQNPYLVFNIVAHTLMFHMNHGLKVVR